MSAAGRHSTIVTRFPPEPNGYLHIGHAKSICLNFGVAQEFGGRCHLRFDDTNPVKEEQEYIDAIEADIRWLGFDWGEHLYHASDYFEQLYDWAVHLIRNGNAYVDDLSADEIREHRGTLTEPGRNSPWRDRPVDENLDLFARMRAGEFPNGARVLRAKIDMASPNINLRDPVLYRIVHATHPRTGDAWSIYPTYDFAHGQSDAIEGVTHSICTLEFEAHRPLYDWLIEHLPVPSRPRQYEFARLNLTYTVLSKRFLLRLVDEGHVRGWDDPRMPTISGLRRRGFPAEGIRDFADDGRRRQVGQRHRVSASSSTRCETCSTGRRRDASACWTRSRSSSRTTRRARPRRCEVPNNPEDPSAGHAARALLARAVDRARRLHGGAGAEVLPARAGPRGAAPGGVLRHLPRASSRTPPARVSSCAAPTTLRPAAAMRPTAAGRRRRCTGCRPRTPSRPRCGSTTISSRGPTRAPSDDLLADLNPDSETVLTGALRRAVAWPTPSRARPFSSSGSATSRRIPIRDPGDPCSTGR